MAGLGDQAEVCAGLMQWDYGRYEGRWTADIRLEVSGWTIWRDGVPGDESAAEVGARANRVVERAMAESGEVVLFAHGHLLRVLVARWPGMLPTDGRLALAPATISSFLLLPVPSA